MQFAISVAGRPAGSSALQLFVINITARRQLIRIHLPIGKVFVLQCKRLEAAHCLPARALRDVSNWRS
jgi:hypothetical protein